MSDETTRIPPIDPDEPRPQPQAQPQPPQPPAQPHPQSQPHLQQPPGGSPQGPPQPGPSQGGWGHPPLGPPQQPAWTTPPPPPGQHGQPGAAGTQHPQPPPSSPPPGPSVAGGWQPPPGLGGSSPKPPGGPALGPGTMLLLLQIAAPLFVVLGLSIPEDGSVGWGRATLWAIFGAVAAALPLVVSLAAASPPERRWRITLVATVALVGYWVVVVLPGVTSDSGFLQTLGVGAAVGAAWMLAPGSDD